MLEVPVCDSDVTRRRTGPKNEIPIKNAGILTVKPVLNSWFERKTYSPPAAATPQRARGASRHLRASAESPPIAAKLREDPQLSSGVGTLESLSLPQAYLPHLDRL